MIMQPDTIASRVYKQIRSDIIRGVFPPGTHLVKRALAKKYNVSVLPVLEACLRLENDGLVESSPLLGSFVPQMTAEKLEEEHFFREAIECQIARIYAVRASEHERESMLQLARELDAIEKNGNPETREVNRAFQHKHFRYHVMLAKIARVDLLYQQLKKFWYKRLTFAWNVDKKHFPTPEDWHATLTNALNSGNPERADMAMRHHFNINTQPKKEIIPDSIGQQGDLFDEFLSESGDFDELFT